MRFSVIVPLYNKEPYIQKALESVNKQTFKDFELIVVDDGSTDDSCITAYSFLEKSEISYQLIRQNNSGVSMARNKGVSKSVGDFICFLDADDWWDPSFLEKMNVFIRQYPDAGIYGTNYYYVKNGRMRICVTNAFTGYIDYCSVYADSLAMPLTSTSVAIDRKVFDEMGGFRPYLRLGEDFDLWVRIALRYKVAFLNEPLAFYFQDADPTWRGTGHLVEPKYHFLWNLAYLSDQEINNPNYKQLIDRLRTNGLLRYYSTSRYRLSAMQELGKVDWAKQPKQVQRLYRLPIPVLRFRRFYRTLGSRIKQWMIKHLCA